MAIEESTLQLNAEALAYETAIQLEKDRHRRLLRALNLKDGMNDENEIDDETVASGNTSVSSCRNSKVSTECVLKDTFEAFEYEIKMLTETHNVHMKELQHLDELLKEQICLSKTLSNQEDEILREFNSLELDTKVFKDIHRTLTHQCHSAEKERYLLDSVQIHSALFDIKLDERGLQYPLINNLRLTHQPKGVSWLEINAAWSQACQLVIFIGSTTKFQSKDLRIVPLVTCAKIIELSHGDRRIVHDLGVDFESNARKTHETEDIIPSLRAFLSLLYQMSVHMLKEKPRLGKMPFEMIPHGIGPHDVRQLDDKDDVAWNGVVHAMACNMKWMAQHACIFLPQI